MKKREFLFGSALSLGAAALLLSGCTTTPTSSTPKGVAKQQKIDADVNVTLERLFNTVGGSRELVNKARGVLVFPSVLAAGFIVGEIGRAHV